MQTLIQKAKAIRLVIFDVDGVLTSGNLFYTHQGQHFKDFHVHDGQGIKLLQSTGVIVAVITAKESDIVTKRMQDLEIQHVYQNCSDKLAVYEALKNKLNLVDEQIVYVGDDVPDLPVLCRAGFPITVANATTIAQQYACWVTHAEGGHGAAREICEFIMHAQGTYQAAIAPYLAKVTTS